jgi:hypothetical protein
MDSAAHDKTTNAADRSGSVAFSLIYHIKNERAARVEPKHGLIYPHAQDVDVIVRDYFGQPKKRDLFRDQYVGLVGCADRVPPAGFPLITRGGVGHKVESLLNGLHKARDHRIVGPPNVDDFGRTQFGAVADPSLANVKERAYLLLLDLDTDLIETRRAGGSPARNPRDLAADLDHLPAVEKYEPAMEILARYLDEQRALVAERVAKYVNHQIRAKLKKDFPGDYRKKQAFAKWLGAELRRLDLAIRHPDDDRPCSLFVLPSHDPDRDIGRFVLADRETKKRTWTGLTLSSILPLWFVPDVPRREGLLSRDADS